MSRSSEQVDRLSAKEGEGVMPAQIVPQGLQLNRRVAATPRRQEGYHFAEYPDSAATEGELADEVTDAVLETLSIDRSLTQCPAVDKADSH